jgi:DNA polymerase-3 subunit epsilon
MIDRHQIESLLTLAGIFIFLLGFALAGLITPWLGLEYITVIIVLAVAALLGVGFVFNRFLRSYVFGVRRLAEELRLIMSANPTHRVQLAGPAGIQELTQTINIFADRFQTLLSDEAAKIQQARTDLEEERNRLAALMSELAEGVLVCNLEGRILLYNQRAKQLLEQQPAVEGSANGGHALVGLGRSIFGLIDRKSITHALEDLHYRLEKQNSHPVSQFVTSAANGQLIRARMAPILDQQQVMNGFVLTLEDITRQVEVSIRRDVLVQTLTEGTRAALANIRAAIETIEEYPQMDPNRLNQFRRVIREEAQNLSARLNQTMNDYALDLRANWQLEQMLGSDLLWAIQRRFEDKLAVKTRIEVEEENLWLRLDSYLIVQALTQVMDHLKHDFGVEEISFRLKKTGRIAALDMVWAGAPVEAELFWSWQNQALIAEGEGLPVPLREVAERHGGEVWCQVDKASNSSYLRLLLPIAQPKPTWNIPVAPSSRPEYYDFNLFRQPVQRSDLAERPLAELTYSVFDTETTGLNPAEGDEIISISAVRIVNGRLLRQEVFDQLVDPKRFIPPVSINIHGIVPEMLKGQPSIEQVVPQFFHFIEDTVLVAHNAAFDMRLLQLKETLTGVKFTNPVLDTLLLAAAVHPNQESHSLEAIAQRLGVNVIGRHTSLGDALMTGEIFLKLIPLLAEQGIYTLKEALATAEKTYYARIHY